MKNKEELEKKTDVKRFSCCVMNPPFNSGGERGGEYSIESDFVNNLNKIVDLFMKIFYNKFIKRSLQNNKKNI